MRRNFYSFIFAAAVSILLLVAIFLTSSDFTIGSKFSGDDQILRQLQEAWASGSLSGSTVKEEVQVAHHHYDLHPPHLTLINITNFSIPINYDICNVSDIAIVTIIHSAVQNDLARMVIRSTWGNPEFKNISTRLVFLTGLTENKDQQKKLEEEAETYGDIVQGGFLDTYHNLSYKNIFGKLWVSQFCEQAEIVVKTDDDMFIDLFAVYKYTRQYLTNSQYLNNDFLLCPVWHGMPVLRDKNSKWYASYDDLPESEVPGNTYKPYCTGWIYILNPGTAERIANIAQVTKFFWIDDAWVTGILVDAIKLKHMDMMKYFTMTVERMLLSKSVQNPNIYHKDYMAAPMARDFKISKTFYEHAKLCYFNQCKNNIYNPDLNLTADDLAYDELLDRFFHP